MLVQLYEVLNNFRVIHTDGRPLPTSPEPWFHGHSAARWEGDTLVVDTINFKRETNVPGSSANLHLTERFTRTGPNSLEYRFRIDDPSIWIRAWTAVVPTVKSDEPVYEYACHEGNYAMAGILGGARAAEKAAADAAKTQAK